MLDLLLGYGISYSDYYTGWNETIGADGKATHYINFTSSILTGGASTCILPPLGGRSETIGGSDLKIVVDWMGMLGLLGGDGALKANPKSISIRNSILGFPLGPPAGTSTDFIFGEKNLINYGRSRDSTITRKKSPAIEIKTIKPKPQNGGIEAPLFSRGHKCLIGLPYLVLLGLYTTSRALFLFGSAKSTVIQHTNESLANFTPRLQSTWIATMLTYERLLAVKKHIAEIAQILKQHTDYAARDAQNHVNRLIALPQNTLISAGLAARISEEQKKVNDFLFSAKDYATEEITKAADFLKNVSPLLGDPNNELSTSNQSLVSYYNSLTYSTVEKIELQATDVGNSQTTLQLTPRKIDLKSAGASLRIGGTAGSPGHVEIEVSNHNNSNIFIGSKGNNLSHININKNMISIEGGAANNRNPIIELSDEGIRLRCGIAFNGPEIHIENDKVTIAAGEQVVETGPKFEMTNESIKLTVGLVGAQSSLTIKADGIEIKNGQATSTKWSATGISMSVGENAIKIGLAEVIHKIAVMNEKIDLINKSQETLKKETTDAIADMKQTLSQTN